MSTTYAGDGTNFPTPITIPSDGDAVDAASVNAALQALADRTAYLRVRAAMHYAALNWTMGDALAHNFSMKGVAGGQDGGNDETAWMGVGNKTGSAGTLLYSRNGQKLTQITAGNTKNFDLYGIAHDATDNVWVAVGEADGGDAYLLTTTAGSSPGSSTWNERVNAQDISLRAVATNGTGTYVAGGLNDSAGAYALRSADSGVTWAEITIGSSTDAVWGLAYGGGVWVAVGSDNDAAGTTTVWSSADDGATFTPRTPGAGLVSLMTSVVHNGTAFVAFGHDGEIMRSLDGVTWTTVANPGSAPDNQDIESAATANGIIVAQTIGRGLWVSIDDGVSFIRAPQRPHIDNGNVWRVGTDGNGFLALGADGTDQRASRSGVFPASGLL